MLELIFALFFLSTTSVKDIYTMAKSEIRYWYCRPGCLPYVDQAASDAASVSQFALMYFYAAVFDILLLITGVFTLVMAIRAILTLGILHWFGVEDLWYYILQTWIKFPKEYLETHQFINIGGFGVKINLHWKVISIKLPVLFTVPVSLYWLSKARKFWIFKFPSIIGKICGPEVEGKKFVALSASALIIVIVLSIFI
jgi:hypothetical protein